MGSETILRGRNVTLRSPRTEDAVSRLHLGRDPEIVRMFGGDASKPLPRLTDTEANGWRDGLVRHPHAWIIEHEARLLGEARLDGLNEHDGRARLAIGFHNPTKLGRGLGREAVDLVLRHAFNELCLHRVDLRVLAYNVRAIRCYRSCGFIEEGREREAAVVAGERDDEIIMAILRHEFHGQQAAGAIDSRPSAA